MAAAALVAILAGRREPAPLAPAPRTVAVLPFQNIDADPAFDFLRLALPDEIATTLSRARGVAVRPFSTTSGLDPEDIDITRLGAASRADTLVTGRFGNVEGQRQVTLEAVDVAGDVIVWRATVDAPLQSMIATHQQVALAVRGGLVPALGASVTDTLPEPQNDEAYELYLRSSVLPYDPGPNPQATAMLQRAAPPRSIRTMPTPEALWRPSASSEVTSPARTPTPGNSSDGSPTTSWPSSS